MVNTTIKVMRKGFIFGKFIITTVINAQGAPFIDECSGTTEEGLVYFGRAIQFNPFRFNKYGDRKMGLCLVVGL